MFYNQHKNNDILQNNINEINNANIKNFVKNENMPQPKTLSSIIRDGIVNPTLLNNVIPNYNPYLNSSPYSHIIESKLSNDTKDISKMNVVNGIYNPNFSTISVHPHIRESESKSPDNQPNKKDSKTIMKDIVTEYSNCPCFKNFNCPSCDNSELILKLTGYYNNCPCARQYCKPCINSSKIHELSLLKSFNDKKVLEFLRNNSEIMNQGIINVTKTLERVIQYENEALKASKNLEETKLKAFIARAKMNTNSEKARTIARDTLFSKSFINIKDASAQNIYNNVSSKIIDFPHFPLNKLVEDNNTNTSNSLKSIENSNGFNDISKPPELISDFPFFRKKDKKGGNNSQSIINNLDADFNTIKNYDFSNNLMKNNNNNNKSNYQYRKNSENFLNDDSISIDDPLSKTLRKNLQNDEAMKSINELNKIIYEGAEFIPSNSLSNNKISDGIKENNTGKFSLDNLNNSSDSFTPEEVKSINDIVNDIKSVKSNSFSTNFVKDDDKTAQSNQKNDSNNSDERKSQVYYQEDNENYKSNDKISNSSNKSIVKPKEKENIQKLDESEEDDFKKDDEEDDFEDNDNYDSDNNDPKPDTKPSFIEKRSIRLTKSGNKNNNIKSVSKNKNSKINRKNAKINSNNIKKYHKKKYN